MDIHDLPGFLVLGAVITFIVAARKRRRRGHLTPGPGAMGAVYDLLNRDRRSAIALIVEEKAEARDAEDADGNLPDLELPRRPR